MKEKSKQSYAQDYSLMKARGQQKVVLHERSLGRDYNGKYRLDK